MDFPGFLRVWLDFHFFHKDSYRDSSLILILDFDLDSDVGFDLDLIWIRF